MNFVVIWGLFLGLSVTGIPLAFSIGLTPLLFGLFTGRSSLTVIFQSIVSTNESSTGAISPNDVGGWFDELTQNDARADQAPDSYPS